MKTKKQARILIVDDHPLVREGLVGRFARQADMEVCGEAADVDEALAQAARLKPDLMILDISLKTGSGLEVIKQLRSRAGTSAAALKIIVHSMYDDSLYAERCLQAGAMGYINKQEDPDQLLKAVRQVLAGRVYVCPRIADRLLNRAVGRSAVRDTDPIEKLSNRELEVFRKIGEGLTTRKIANRLSVSVHTIETHRENIKTKLDLADGTALVQRAVQWLLENG